MYLTKTSLLSLRRAYERAYGKVLIWPDTTIRKVAKGAKRRADLLPRLHAYFDQTPWQYSAFIMKYYIKGGKLWQNEHPVREHSIYLYDVRYRRLDVEHLLKHKTWPEGASYG